MGSGSPHRSDGRPPQTPRGARRSGQTAAPASGSAVPRRAGTLPPLCRPFGVSGRLSRRGAPR
ncbi:hypothetical protein DBP22_05300 [Streptomyces sp. CS207]|nr:hypothetical protein DBP22_05300 [Streptomyces sp. CS207]